MINMLAALASSPGGITRSLEDLTLTATAASGNPATADMLFDDDGGRRKFQSNSGGGSTTDAGEWSSLDPNETETWHVRLASHDTGTDRYTGTPTLGTWTEISAAGTPTFDHVWSPGGGPQGPDVSTYTYELSSDGGSTVHDSMTLTVSLSIDSP